MELPVDQTAWKLLDAVPCGCIHCTVHRKSRTILSSVCCKGDLYAVCNKRPRFAKFECANFLNVNIHERLFLLCLLFIYDRRWCNWKWVFWLLMSTTNSISHYNTLLERLIIVLIIAERLLNDQKKNIRSLYRHMKNVIYLLDNFIIIQFYFLIHLRIKFFHWQWGLFVKIINILKYINWEIYIYVFED